eukprot:gene11812-13300_t
MSSQLLGKRVREEEPEQDRPPEGIVEGWDRFKKRYDLDLVTITKYNYFNIFSEVRVEKLSAAAGVVENEEEMVVEAIRLPHPIPGIEGVANSIYIRPSFYPDLMEECFSGNKHVILLGNPGISKSFSQFVILCALLGKEEQIKESNTLKKIREKLNHINVVVRDVGNTRYDIFFIKERLQYVIESPRDTMFDYLSDSQTLYLFDSGLIKEAIPRVSSSCCRTLLTLSPLKSRYSEFEKQKTAKVCYMPLYNKEELIAIGLDMLGQDDFPVEMK